METTLIDNIQKVTEQQNGMYLALFGIIMLTVVILLGVVVLMQKKQIDDLRRPKFGFLGKPIFAMLLVAFSLGGFGLVYYTSNSSSSIGDTSADRKVELQIKSTYLGQGYDYMLKLIPTVDGKAWGGNNSNMFDVYWTIQNKMIVTEAEIDLSLNNQGGITKTLEKGKNKIKTTVFFENKSYSAETMVEL